MKYTNSLWNKSYLNYDIILPRNRKLKKFLRPFLIPIFIFYIILCSSMCTASIPYDGYRSLKFLYYKKFR